MRPPRMRGRRRTPFGVLGGAAVLALAACGGGQRSTLPPAPGPAGFVALAQLAAHPEVYADARVQTIGTVASMRLRGARHLILAGASGPRIVLEPTSAALADLGRRVRVTGIFTVTFELGYEILVSRIVPSTGSL